MDIKWQSHEEYFMYAYMTRIMDNKQDSGEIFLP